MNHVYRVVWRAALGTWVAVAEIAHGRAKSSRTGHGADSAVVRFARAALRMLPLSGAIAASWAMAQTAVVAPGSQANVYVSPNGVTVVNINGANGAGLSHNRYTQFNVDAKGLVLNNTNTAQMQYQSQLAGQVMANYNMANPARVILNEVVSANRSLLAGYTEVLGGRADVVLANPYGITCNGCGFINTDRVTLSTGVPNLRADGSLGGFAVSQGDILINGTGLNGSAQQILDLVTRSVKIDGQINAQDLGIFTGANNWDYGTRSVTGPAAAAGAAPNYAIDSSVLGGMYANRIRLVATDAGVGVRMLGNAAANGDDFTLNAAGRIELTGNRISAQRDILLASTDASAAAIALANASATAGRNAGVQAGNGGISLDAGLVVAGGELQAGAKSLSSTGASRLQAGSSLNATATGGDLSLDAAAVKSEGDMQLTASGAVRTASGEGQGVQSTGGNIAIGAGTGLFNEGVISADKGSLAVRAGSVDNGGTLNAGQSVDIADAGAGSTASVANRGDVIAGTSLAVQASDVANSGWLQAGTDNRIAATNLTNNGKVIAATGSVDLQVDAALDNTGSVRAAKDIALAGRNGARTQRLNNSGDILAAGAQRIQAQAVANQKSGWIQAATGSQVQADSIDNAGTWLTSQQGGASDSVAVGGSFTNSGAMQSAGDLAVAAGSFDNSNALAAAGTLGVQTATSLRNAGILQAGGAMTLDSGSVLTNTAGALVAGASVSASASQGLDNDGTVSADGNATLRASGSIDNSGTIQAGGNLDIADRNAGATANVTNSGKLLADGTMNMQAAALKNESTGWVQAVQGSTVTASSMNNQGVWLLSSAAGAPASQVTVSGTLVNAGVLQAQQDARLAAQRLENQAGAHLRTGGNLQAQIGSGGLLNAGTLQAGNGSAGNGATLDLNAGGAALVNTGVMLGDRLAVAVGSIDNSGTIQGGASASSSIEASGTVNNRADGVITVASTAGGGGTLTGKGIVNDGALQSLGSLTLAVGSDGLQNRADGIAGHGDILADKALTVKASGANSYTATLAGRVQSGGLLSIGGAGSSLVLTGSASGDSVSIDLANVSLGMQAVLASQQNLAVQAQKLSIASGTLNGDVVTGRILAALASSGADTDTAKGMVRVTQSLDNKGLIFSANDLEVQAPSITVGSTSALSALRDLSVSATDGELDLSLAAPAAGAGNIAVQDQGLLYAGRNLSARANGKLSNRGQVLAGNSIDLLANTVENNAEINSDNDIRIVAATLLNQPQGGDTRVFSSTEGSAGSVKEGGEYDDNGDGGNLNIAQNWRKTFTETLGFAPGATPTDKPQITGGRNVQLVFHTAKNLGGLIYGGNSVDLVGFSVNGAVTDLQAMKDWNVVDGKHGYSQGGATFTNDSLATRTWTKTIRWTQHREEAGWAGGVENFDWRLCSRAGSWDDVCDYDGYQPAVTDNLVSNEVMTAGVYTRTLTGNGFALYNQGGTNPAPVASAKTGDSTTRDAIDDRSKEGGPATATAKGGPAYAGALTRTSLNATTDAPTLAGMSFLDANAANGVKGTSFGGINITLPGNPNGYFVVSRDPGSRYLVETNPLYLSGGATVGSDYLSKLLGYNPDQIGLRLGDASYEAWLVKQQLIKQTGNGVLASYAGADTQMKGLMESAAKESMSLGLQYGKALTPEQQANLKQDIVWMVQTEIEGKVVLAPVVYLSQATKNNIATGAVISAQDANLSVSSLTNSGGTIVGSKSLVVASTGDISNLSGLIKGANVSLTSSEGSIVNKTVSEGSGGDKFYNTVIGRTAGIESTGTLSLDAKKDITNIGATMTAGTDASLKAGNNITFDTIEGKKTNSTSGHYEADGGSGRTRTTQTTVTQVKSGLTVGGNLDAKAGNDITLAGTDAKVGGNASLDAGNNLNIVARENSTTTHTESQASGFGMNNSLYGSTTTTTDSTSIRNVGSTLEVGGNATMKAGNDITFQGSTVDVRGSGDLQAGNNINVLAGRNYDETSTTTKKTGVMQVSSGSGKSKESEASAQAGSGRGLASASAGASGSAGGQGSAGLAFSSTTTTTSNSTDLVHVGSTLNFGKDLNVSAGKDVNLQGSTINAGGNATVSATNVNLLAAEDVHTTSTTTTTTRVGLMASTNNKAGGSADASASAQGGKGTPGASAQANAAGQVSSENRLDLFQQEKSSSTTLDTKNQGSAINAGGNLSVTATDTLTLQGSGMSSGGNMDLKATDMKFLAAEDKHESTSSSSKTSAGLYADAKAQGSAKAGADVGLGAQAGASAGGSAGVEVGLYGSNTTAHSVEGSTTAVTSSLKSGGDINRTATNNITDVGTQIEGAGSLNQSAQTIDSFAARNTTYSSSDSTTHTAKIGAYAEAGAQFTAQGQVGSNANKPKSESGAGAGIRASYEYDNSTSSSSSSTAVTSSIKMGGSVNSTSSGKTTMEGTQIQAGQDVNLSASSLDYQAAKNTSSSNSKDTSANASVGVDLVKKEVAVGVGYDGNKSSESSSTAVVGGISAGGNLNVKTTGDARFEGTNLAAGGAATVDAGGNVKFDAAKNTAKSSSEGLGVDVAASGGKSGGAGSAAVSVSKSNYSLDQDVAGSITSGSGPLTIKSGGDASFTGTQIASTSGNVTVAAGGNIDMKAARTIEHSDSLGVDVSASGSGGKDTKGGVKNAGTGKKTGGTNVDQRAGAASLGVSSSKSDSNQASVGSITSGGGSITLSSGGNAKLEGTKVSAANGIGVSTGGTFEMKDAVSTSSSSTVGVSASASGSSQTPRPKGTNQTVTGGQAGAALPSTGGLMGGGVKGSNSPAPAPAPAAPSTSPSPAPKPGQAPSSTPGSTTKPPATSPPATPGTGKPPAVSPPPTPGSSGGASNPPSAPPPLNPALQQTLNQANLGTGAGSNVTGSANNTNTAALTQKGGSGVASVYVDNQSSTSSQAATLNGGSGGITIQQGVKAAPISAAVALPPAPPNAPKPTATTQDGKPLPSWLKFDAATGKFQGTPPADFKGEVKVQVKVPQADGSVKNVPMTFGSAK